MFKGLIEAALRSCNYRAGYVRSYYCTNFQVQIKSTGEVFKGVREDFFHRQVYGGKSPDYIGLRLTDFGFSCTIFGVAYPKPQKFRDRELRSE